MHTGIQNGKANTLRLQSRDLPKVEDERGSPSIFLIRSEKISANFENHTFSTSILTTTYRDEILLTLQTDVLWQELIKTLKNGLKPYPQVLLRECEIKQGLLLVNGLIYISDNP